MPYKNLIRALMAALFAFVLATSSASAEPGPYDVLRSATVVDKQDERFKVYMQNNNAVECGEKMVVAVNEVTGEQICASLMISLSVNPNPVPRGGSASFSWSVWPTTDCWDSFGHSTWGNYSFSTTVNGEFTWTVSCMGAGIESQSVNVGVYDPPPPPPPAPAPTVSLTANPTSISSGGSSTLSWSASDANSCSAPWTSSTATSGSAVLRPTATTTYSITCSGNGGSASASAQVTVGPIICPEKAPGDGAMATSLEVMSGCVYPTVDIYASPTSVAYNGYVTVGWTVTNASQGCVSSSDPWTNFATGGSMQGSQVVGPLTQTTTFNYVCKGDGGATSRDYVVVSVGAAPPPPPPAPTAVLTASSTNIDGGASVTLSWSSTGATSCSTSWAGVQAASGSLSVMPKDTTTYSVDCNGAKASVTVTVNIPAPDSQYYAGSQWTDDPPYQLIYIPKVGCTRVGDGVKYQRPGRVHWTYISRVSFCWNGKTVTQVYAHEVAADMNQPPWPLSLYQSWVYSSVSYEGGSAGASMTIVRAQGSFEYCAFKYGCLNTQQPWIRIEINRRGQAICTTSARTTAHACVRF